jgi:hemerythrin-like domain-containing protein
MKLTLELLYRDHDSLRRILYLLEQLLIDIYRGSSQSYPMIQRLLAYIQDHPERVHHPAEEAIFSVIFKKGLSNRKFREDVKTLMKDHSEIESLIRNAVEALSCMLASTNPDITDFGDKLSILLNRQRSHLLFEEMNVYPYIAKHLGNEDWEEITELVPDYKQPIFGDQIKKEHELIFKTL